MDGNLLPSTHIKSMTSFVIKQNKGVTISVKSQRGEARFKGDLPGLSLVSSRIKTNVHSLFYCIPHTTTFQVMYKL